MTLLSNTNLTAAADDICTMRAALNMTPPPGVRIGPPPFSSERYYAKNEKSPKTCELCDASIPGLFVDKLMLLKNLLKAREQLVKKMDGEVYVAGPKGDGKLERVVKKIL